MHEPVYEVFARKGREEPLRHIGYVNASDDELARVYAWKTYDEQNWFEMCVVPRAMMLPVCGPRAEAAAAERAAADRAADAALIRAARAGGYGGEVAPEVAP